MRFKWKARCPRCKGSVAYKDYKCGNCGDGCYVIDQRALVCNKCNHIGAYDDSIGCIHCQSAVMNPGQITLLGKLRIFDIPLLFLTGGIWSIWIFYRWFSMMHNRAVRKYG